MPFTGPDDKKLPDNVASMSEKRRKQFVAVFNSAHEKCMADGGDDKKCEGAAFTQAHGVVGAKDGAMDEELITDEEETAEESKEEQTPAEAEIVAKETGAQEEESLESADAQDEAESKEHENLDEKPSAIRDAFREEFDRRRQMPEDPGWVTTVFDDFVIVDQGGKMLKYPYVENEEGEFVFGDPVEVEMTFEEKPEVAQEMKTFGVKAHPDGVVGHIHGWGAPYGGPHDGKDLDGEYFDGRTDFALEWYPNGRPILYQHGKDKSVGIVPVGRENSSTALDMGIWVDAQLDMQKKYAQAIWQMMENGELPLFWSSGAMHHLVQRAQDGHLRRWPICEYTLTPTPANLLATVGPVEAKAHFEAVGLKLKELPMEEEKKEEVKAPAIDVEAMKASLLSELKAELKADAEAEQEAVREAKEARDKQRAEIKAELMLELAEESKDKGLPFPLGVEEKEELVVPEHIKRYSVSSRYDSQPFQNLCIEYQIRKRGGLIGGATPPSERLYRAMAVKANQFLQETDDIPYIDAYGEVKTAKNVPAFDPRVMTRSIWNAGDSSDGMVVPGVGFVPVRDNVTPEGVKSAMKLASMKADELVFSTQSNEGDEWVPTLSAAALWRTIRLEARVLSTIEQFNMISQPQTIPAESTDPVFYKVIETEDEAGLLFGSNLTTESSKPGTAQVTYTAGKTGAISFWSEEMAEDSIIPIEPQFRDQYGIAMAHNLDYILLNGDETTTTLNISSWGTSLTVERALVLDGLRHDALISGTNTTRSGGTLTIDDINATRKKMGTNGVFGANNSDLVIFCDVPTSYKFEDLDEVLTIDKFGPQATVLRGELGRLKNIPIIRSTDYVLTDSSGYINDTAGDNTLGSFIIVNRRGVKVGWRRRPRIVVGQVPYGDAWYIIMLARLDIGFQSGTSGGYVGMSYNLTV